MVKPWLSVLFLLGRGPNSACLLEEEMSQTSLGPSTLTLQLCAGNALICTMDVGYTDVYCIHIHVCLLQLSVI